MKIFIVDLYQPLRGAHGSECELCGFAVVSARDVVDAYIEAAKLVRWKPVHYDAVEWTRPLRPNQLNHFFVVNPPRGP